MAVTSNAPVGRQTAYPSTGYIEWGAVFAGGAMAAAISFVLLTFGSAIGFSMTSPWEDSGISAKTAGGLAVFWTVAQQIGALLIGGYVAGRMRSQWADTSVDNVEFRDGLHGGLVWAIGVIIGAALVLSTVGSIARSGADIAGKAASAVAANADPLAYQIDTLLRPATGPAAPTGPAAAAPPSAPPQTAPAGNNSDPRAEMTRIFARSVTAGTLTENDRAYLTSLIAQRAGISQQEAEQRVRNTYAEATRVAKETAEKVRRTAMLAGFVTAASLLLSLAAAWWAAVRGGHHRDHSIPARLFGAQAGMRRP